MNNNNNNTLETTQNNKKIPIDSDDQGFAEDQLKLYHGEQIKFIEWVDSRSLTSKRFKKRIIVLGNYRILSIKKGKLSTSLNKDICIYDIHEIIVVEDTIEIRQKQTNPKTGDQVGILIRTQKETIQTFIQTIREIHRKISHNFPESQQLKLNIPADYLLKLPEKIVGIADGFIEVYKAQCNYRNTPHSTELCRLVEKYVHDGITDFDLSKCPGVEGKSELNFNIETILISLKYNTYFQSISLNSVSQKNIMSAVGDIISTNCYIKKLAISGITDEQTYATIGHGMIQNLYNSIQVLDLSHNNIIQSTMGIFCEGLESLRHPLKYINLSHCSLHSRSIEIFFQALSVNTTMSTTIEYINLSHSKFEDIGSSTCSAWITKIKEKFYLGSCMLNLLMLGPQLKLLTDLKTLDLGNNRLERAEIDEILSILSTSRGLENFTLNNVNLSTENVLYMCNTISKNIKLKEISLFIPNNSIGKVVNTLVTSFKYLSTLHSLDVSNNGLGFKGLSRLLDALEKNERIYSLKLDNNFVGPYNEGIEFINELKSFISKKPSLKKLSIVGGSQTINDKLMGQFLEYLAFKNATLEQLNISSNLLGDQTVPFVADLLEHNPAIKSLEFDRNSFTINAFQSILLSIQNNHSLVNLQFPSHDFERSLSMLPPHRKPQLFTIFHKIQNILQENGNWVVPDENDYPTPAGIANGNITNGRSGRSNSNGSTHSNNSGSNHIHINGNNNNFDRTYSYYGGSAGSSSIETNHYYESSPTTTQTPNLPPKRESAMISNNRYTPQLTREQIQQQQQQQQYYQPPPRPTHFPSDLSLTESFESRINSLSDVE
eukprot:gene7911-9737_t